MNKHDEKQAEKRAVKYVLSNLKKEDHDGKHLTTYKARLFYFLQCFVSEYDSRIRKVGVRRAMTEYLSGFPSAYCGAFYTEDIITLGIKWGYLTMRSGEGTKWDFINNCYIKTATILEKEAVARKVATKYECFTPRLFIAKFK